MNIKFTYSAILLKIFISTNCIHSYPNPSQQRDSIVLDYSNYNSFQPHGAGSYSFGYEIEDPEYHNIQYRDEERQPNGTVTGSYGWVKPDGNIIMVRYIADEKGYRASVENSAGQLKFYGQPIPPPLKYTTKSSALLNALNNLKLYKQQSIQEQHYRPIDLQKPYNFQNKIGENIYEVDNFNDNNNIVDLPENYDFYNLEPQRNHFYFGPLNNV